MPDEFPVNPGLIGYLINEVFTSRNQPVEIVISQERIAIHTSLVTRRGRRITIDWSPYFATKKAVSRGDCRLLEYADFAYPSISIYKVVVRKSIHTPQHQRLLRLLRNIRTEAGLTQSDLAARIHKDQTFISKYESGERRLDVLELREICKAVGLSLTQFVRKLDKIID